MSPSEAAGTEAEGTAAVLAQAVDVARRCAADADEGRLTVEPSGARALLAAAVRLYAALDEYGELEPIDGTDVTATEAVVGATALMDAQHLNAFDLQLWISRTAEAE